MLQAPGCSDFIGKKGWGGYTWNRTLFPSPEDFVTMLHNKYNVVRDQQNEQGRKQNK